MAIQLRLPGRVVGQPDEEMAAMRGDAQSVETGDDRAQSCRHSSRSRPVAVRFLNPVQISRGHTLETHRRCPVTTGEEEKHRHPSILIRVQKGSGGGRAARVEGGRAAITEGDSAPVVISVVSIAVVLPDCASSSPESPHGDAAGDSAPVPSEANSSGGDSPVCSPPTGNRAGVQPEEDQPALGGERGESDADSKTDPPAEHQDLLRKTY
ncbi:hypothetical protein ACP70R_041442 [Stipagrostis hirtigluma subsp. patula]